MTKAVFVTNAGPNIGGGHLSRCFALSQALRMRGVECGWILNREARALAKSLSITGAEYRDDLFSESGASLLDSASFAVMDSYVPSAEFYKSAAERTKLVVIDDLHDGNAERFASVMVNYGVMARREFYSGANREYLLGPRYALLRREYWDINTKTGDYVLFVPGAADVAGSAESMAEWWRDEMGRIVIILGSLVSSERYARAARAASGKANVEILVSPPNFASLLAGAGRVICSASVTAYESLALEKTTALFTVADNQRGLGEYLRGTDAAYDLGDWESVGLDAITRALNFEPKPSAIRGLVNKRGAVDCADGILRLLVLQKHIPQRCVTK